MEWVSILSRISYSENNQICNEQNYIDGLVQDCGNFIVNALALLQSCA